jgi:hypothetical protein
MSTDRAQSAVGSEAMGIFKDDVSEIKRIDDSGFQHEVRHAKNSQGSDSQKKQYNEELKDEVHELTENLKGIKI